MSSLFEKLAVPWLHRASSVRGSRDSSPALAEDAPLRAELFSVAQLEQHARALAAMHVLEPPGRPAVERLLPRLDDNESELQEAHEGILAALGRGRRITPAAEWLVDNYYLVEDQIRLARRHLPRGYSRELPRLSRGPGAGLPRVYDLALELVSHSDGKLDVAGVAAFVASYQSVRPLRLGELWAVPIMLRLALLENLRRVVARVSAGRVEREAADGWVQRMLDTSATAPAKVVLVLAEMVDADPPLTHAFVAELASRLQALGPSLVLPMSWLEHRLAERGESLAHVFQRVSQTQAADQVSIGNVIGSLRLLGATDWRDFVESTSVVERRLERDPAGVYARMDFETRDRYRHVVEEIAKLASSSEEAVADAAVALAREGSERRGHVGFYLVGEGRLSLERAVGLRVGRWELATRPGGRLRFPLYVAAMVVPTLLATWALVVGAQARGVAGAELVLVGGLLFVATSQLTSALVNFVATLLVRPSVLPRLDFSSGIPLEHRTAVAVPALLTDAAEVDSLLEALEVRYLANRDPNLVFVLLTDFRDAPTQHREGDAELLARARDGILALDARHVAPGAPPVFFLAHRERRWNPREGVWMGWERKRGKLEQWNAALRGDVGDLELTPEEPEHLRGIANVIVLDADTQLPRDAARKLVGTLAHPLHRPRFDPDVGRVVEGYAILQPRVAITMASARRSRFSRLFAGEPGIDPYTRAVSDVYQDLFGEGSFVGKGIYAVDAFRQAVGGRLPENRVLSHDLLEAAYVRSGMVSDVLLFEDFPSTFAVEVSRRDRWTRGDWQLLAWLRRRVPAAGGGDRVPNPISRLSQWKLLDNLRRSLVPAALLALLLVGFATPGLAAWTMLVVLAIALLPGLLVAAAGLARRPSELPRSLHARELASAWGQQLGREAFALACLPYDAFVAASAILRTGFRLLVSGRTLLSWRTASDAQRNVRAGLLGTYLFMGVAPLTAIATAVGLSFGHREALPVAAPVLLAWILAPALASWLSRPTRESRPVLAEDERAFLRRLARRTWGFFETYVGPADNHLPPDNFQEEPPVGIAHRTSPTNLGLALTSTLAAYDFGYVASGELVERLGRTFESLDRMQRHRGHFYNWYDTRTLEPLRPMYVSTVDSGNLVGHLLTLASGLRELAGTGPARGEVFAGLGDTLDVIADTLDGIADLSHEAREVRTQVEALRASLEASPETPLSSFALLERLHGRSGLLVHAATESADPRLVSFARAFESQVGHALADLRDLAPWLALPHAPATLGRVAERALFEATPSLRDLAAFARTVGPALELERTSAAAGNAVYLADLAGAVALGASRAAARIAELERLATRAEELADVDYDFLYDRDRHLLAIGYDVADHRLDASFYDLLASEARLASFVAIAQGKLPQEHWFSLGRLLTTSVGTQALLSWSGSMFEYLMPLLIMPTYRGTLLDETYRGVVDRQIEYGRSRGVPWGVSESGYNKTDAQRSYAYRAFGVPGLGFQRGLADDLVIAPYASAMALTVAPVEACANLVRLAREGRLGPYGFYEAVDYTPARLPPGKESVTVASYMAHHQGMVFLSLAYLLLDRPMQRRFDAIPAFRATDLLLQERVPRALAIFPHAAEVSAAASALSASEPTLRVFTTPSTPAPQVQLLSNGAYHVMVTQAGGGYSRWRDLAVTRWREDPTGDGWGSFCYVRDVGTGSVWSVAHQPTLVRANDYEAVFSQGRAEFRRRDGELQTHVEIAVSPEDDVELRRVTVSNVGRHARTIELTSLAEVVLATPGADVAHPAFSNLFVETEILRERQAILCRRRPRSGDEKPPFLVHLATVQGRLASEPSFETSREEFLGRGRSAVDPRAMHRPTLSGTEGAVLDPVVAIRNTVAIGPDETVHVHFVTGVTETREAALALAEKYTDARSADRVFDLSWTHGQGLLRQLGATESDARLYERLAGHILYSNPTLRAPRSVIARNQRGQASLWAYGISGDLPIALVRIADREHLELVRQMVRAHAYFRLKGLAVDLVVWNEDASGYRQTLHDEILAVVAAQSETELLDRPGGIFVRRADQTSEEDKVLFQTVARVLVVDTDGTLAEQLDRRPPVEPKAAPFTGKERRAERAHAPPRALPRAERPDLVGWNGFGGFTPDGREYVVLTSAESRTPAPWVNVLANPYFGSVVSESGGAYTWCENARHHRLTPWNDDPVSDPSGEAFYLRDEKDGHVWSPTASPAPSGERYTTRHGFGYSVFEHQNEGIESELRVFVATDAPIKLSLFRLANRSDRPRQLSLTAVFELVLGENRAGHLPHVVTEVDPGSGALFARNAYGGEFARRVAFLDCSETDRTHTGDRGEILGRNGTYARPAFASQARLSGRVGAGLDPCLAMQAKIDLAPGQEREIAFTFGSGYDLEDARRLVPRFRGVGPAHAALEGVWAHWNHTLGAVHVRTPEPTFDFLANGWLLYQVLAARMWGRSGFYQSGGAYGFRDQLQDAMALVQAEPGLLREQILRASERQFHEGDVQHWWHPPDGRGVRTRISDDFLWLPYAVCRYVTAIGDTGVLDERTSFLEGRAVTKDEDAYYDLPLRSDETGTVYEHCVRAIEHGLRFGAHGLPLMGTGDWNDGMNLVGDRGKGESVWLAFFLHDVLVRFRELARGRQDEVFAARCATVAATLRGSIDAHAWDGAWYRRAYFDDGEPLGSSENVDCQIDSLPQSWAVLTGACDPTRARTALDSVDARLVDRELGLVRLLDPPFDRSSANPGYVKGYVPGVRENGGQYTHAAVWAAMAFAAVGDVERAWEVFRLIHPMHHGGSEAAIARYKVEPYVLAADVYTNPQHAGRGGWTWYTGSAGWMYRLAIESLLGLELEVDRLRIEPRLPPGWESFDVHYRYRRTVYHLHVSGPATGGVGAARVVSDGIERLDRTIPLVDDGEEHHADVWVSPPP